MPSEISFHETHLPEFLLFAMAAGEPTRQDPSAPKVLLTDHVCVSPRVHYGVTPQPFDLIYNTSCVVI